MNFSVAESGKRGPGQSALESVVGGATYCDLLVIEGKDQGVEKL